MDTGPDQTTSSLNSAVKGLSPFAVPHLTESEIDDFNDHAEAIHEATSTSVADVQSNKIKAKAPKSFEELLRHLKRFANLLFAIFGEGCKMLIALLSTIEDLDNYNDTARANTSATTMAAIMWIVMQQSRHFAAGKMSGGTQFLPTFANMAMLIKVETPVICNSMPAALILSTGGKRSNENGTDQHGKKKTKKENDNAGNRQYRAHADCYHPKMKAAMAPFVAMSPKPTITKICSAAGTHATELFDDANLCIRTQLLGACDSACTHTHKLVSDSIVDKALAKLKPVIDAPHLVNRR